MNFDFDRKIILEGGQEYLGCSFGADGEKILEIVFNTSVVGYQEILSAPSYTDQAVVMTYPLIGNYGMADDDYESDFHGAGAMIVREYNPEPSNFRSRASLGEVMRSHGVAGVYGIDTRKLTRYIRDFGSCKALITNSSTSLEEGLAKIHSFSLPRDAVSRVSCPKRKEIRAAQELFHVAAIDCGMKRSIVRSLTERGCKVTVVSWDTSAREIMSLKPDGIFISNGPGNPEDVPQTIETIRTLRGLCPMFGICLGHQIIALSYGARTYKLKFRHRGGNHPVKNLETGKIEITSQNHSYAVDIESLKNTPLTLTHVNLPFRAVHRHHEGAQSTCLKELTSRKFSSSAQAAEFDYAGTQACLALKEEGYEVILCNSNPATMRLSCLNAELSFSGRPAVQLSWQRIANSSRVCARDSENLYCLLLQHLHLMKA